MYLCNSCKTHYTITFYTHSSSNIQMFMFLVDRKWLKFGINKPALFQRWSIMSLLFSDRCSVLGGEAFSLEGAVFVWCLSLTEHAVLCLKWPDSSLEGVWVKMHYSLLSSKTNASPCVVFSFSFCFFFFSGCLILWLRIHISKQVRV